MQTVSQYATEHKISRQAVLKKILTRAVHAKRVGSVWLITSDKPWKKRKTSNELNLRSVKIDEISEKI